MRRPYRLLLATALAGATLATPAVARPRPAATLVGAIREETLDVGGQRFRYLRAGRGAPVILLHGFPQTAREWTGVMTRLAAAGYDVIALNLPGIDGSTNPDGDYSKAALARDVHAFAQALRLGPTHIVGHDIGAMVAYAYAAQFTADTRTLTFMEAPLPGTETFRQTAADPRAWHFSFNAAPGMPEALVTGREDVYLRDFFTKVGGGYTPPEAEIRAYVRAYADPATLKAGFGLYRGFAQDAKDNERFMRTPLAMPVLALSAGDLAPVPYVLDMMRPLGTNVTGGVIAGAGHWLNEEAPDEVSRRLIAHFGRLDRTAP